VAIKVGEPKMEIDAEAAEEVDADERLGYIWLRPGGTTSDSSRHGGAVGALLGCSVVKHSRLSSFARQNNNMSKPFSVHAIRFAPDRKAADRGHFRNIRKVVAHSSIWG
jgi:hypothetical protein